jgi:hypothetical protein
MPDLSNSWTQTIDTFYTTTWMYRKPQATEQAYLKTPFIYWLKETGHVDYIAGHRRIEVPVEYGDNETTRWITKGGTVPITDSELVTMTYEVWKDISVSIVRWFQEDRENRGKAQMINLAKLKLGAAERAIYEELERVMFADGSGTNEPNGLQNLVAASPTTGTVHGINRATSAYWRNQTKSAGGAFDLYGIKEMRVCLNNIIKYSRAEIKDLVIVTDQTTFEAYEQEGYDIYELSDNRLYDAGFDTLTFRRRPIMWCPSSPEAKMYFLNTNYLKLVVDKDFWMEMTDWKTIPNQPHDRVAQITSTLNMVCTRPIVNLVYTDITY